MFHTMVSSAPVVDFSHLWSWMVNKWPTASWLSRCWAWCTTRIWTPEWNKKTKSFSMPWTLCSTTIFIGELIKKGKFSHFCHIFKIAPANLSSLRAVIDFWTELFLFERNKRCPTKTQFLAHFHPYFGTKFFIKDSPVCLSLFSGKYLIICKFFRHRHCVVVCTFIAKISAFEQWQIIWFFLSSLLLWPQNTLDINFSFSLFLFSC